MILRIPSLLSVCFLSMMAIVLAYLGGVMTGRVYWHAHPETHQEAIGESVQKRVDEKTLEKASEPQQVKAASAQEQKVLAAEDLRFSRVLRNESPLADVQAKQSPPPSKPSKSQPTAQATSAITAVEQPSTRQAPASTDPLQQQIAGTSAKVYDYVFQMGAFKDQDTVDAVRQRLEGRGLRTRMQRTGKLYLVLVLLRGDATRAAEVLQAAESLRLGKPVQLSRKPVSQP
ncbi:MAG: SPOR domain-containing protein [Desulfovibrio sp.]|nr:SPOR domain-containing protein [Desulfovibrio sp.]